VVFLRRQITLMYLNSLNTITSIDSSASEVESIEFAFQEHGDGERAGRRIPRGFRHLFVYAVWERHVQPVLGTPHFHRVLRHVRTNVRHTVSRHFHIDHHRLTARSQRRLGAHLQKKTKETREGFLTFSDFTYTCIHDWFDTKTI